VPEAFLTGKDCPCPFCGGTDRFVFTDFKKEGRWFCRGCTSSGGDGFDLVQRYLKIGGYFAQTAKRVDQALERLSLAGPKGISVGVLHRVVAEGSEGTQGNRAESSMPGRLSPLWSRTIPIEATSPVATYLARRSIIFPTGVFPDELRAVPCARHYHPETGETHHPAMVGHVLAPDGLSSTVHMTFLDQDGNKADVSNQKQFASKKASGPVPPGGAVRLAPVRDGLIGIAEGIETALSAAILFDVPVWATLNVSGIRKFEPPADVKRLSIFADHDENRVGQAAAFETAHRLTKQGLDVEVHRPDHVGTDFNDVLIGRQALPRVGRAA
jgi:putative DNA primase/helicase